MRLLALLCCAGLVTASVATPAQAYPEKPIRLIVSTPPGTAPDLVARLIGPALTKIWGQPVIIESKVGANGNFAANEVSRAVPDGYTLLVTPAGTVTANPFLYPRTAVTDLSPISQIGSVDFTISVRASLGVKSLQDLVTLIRSNPGTITCATTAHGSFPHLAAELLKQEANLDYLIVKHNGGAAAGTSVAGEHTDFVVETAAVLAPFIESRKLVPLATTGEKRTPAAPTLPTASEAAVPGYTLTGWIALLGPRGLPDEIASRVQQALAQALAEATVREKMLAMHFTLIGNTPRAFKQIIDAERKKLSAIIEKAGLRQD